MGVSKKLLALVLIFSSAGGAILGASVTPKPKSAVIRNTSDSKPLAQVKSAETEQLATPISNLTYKDSGGFSFKYPQGVLVADITPPNGKYNSMLRLTKATLPGELRITVTTTSYKSIDEWVFKEKFGIGAELVGATKLATLPSKQYRKAKMLYTVALEGGLLYTIEGPSSIDWAEIHDFVVASFSLDS